MLLLWVCGWGASGGGILGPFWVCILGAGFATPQWTCDVTKAGGRGGTLELPVGCGHP